MNRALGKKLVELSALRFLPLRWRITGFVGAGIVAGLGLFTLHISRATSYLSDAPETCTNCHVMNTQYLTWQHSSHGRVATCNDCHVPHDSFFSHYAFKAADGLKHATIYTLRLEPQVIRLSHGAIPVVEDNCRRCHAAVIGEVALDAHAGGDLRCWDCHRDVPHGSVRSLSTTPNVFQPQLPSVLSPQQEPKIGGRPPRPHQEPLP